VALATLLLGSALAVLAVLAARTGSQSSLVQTYTPGPGVPRLDGGGFAVRDMARAGGFDIARGRLYVLDPPNHRVVILEQSSTGWIPRLTFGRFGGGPGEFEAPYGVAVTPDGETVAVTDGARVHFFTGAGEYLRSHPLATSCPVLRPEIAAGASGFFVWGTCYRGNPPDTLLAVLYHTPDGESYTRVAEDVRLTRDGRIGSYLTDATFAPGPGRHLFGAGATPCVMRVAESPDPGAVPSAARECGAHTLYGAPPDEGTEAVLREQRRRRPGFAAAFTWPRHLPVYRTHVLAPSGDVMLRAFSADSLVLRAAGSGTDLLVAPWSGLVGCRRSGCLWASATPHGMDLVLLDSATMESLIKEREQP
jgi:hypothetical protein